MMLNQDNSWKNDSNDAKPRSQMERRHADAKTKLFNSHTLPKC